MVLVAYLRQCIEYIVQGCWITMVLRWQLCLLMFHFADGCNVLNCYQQCLFADRFRTIEDSVGKATHSYSIPLIKLSLTCFCTRGK